MAAQLRVQNKEVLAIEKDPELVQKWSGVLTHVVSADATDIDTLHQLGADDFGPPWWVWAPRLRRPCSLPQTSWTWAWNASGRKAITPAHGKILERIGAHHVVYPEADAGRRAAHLVSGRLLDYIESTTTSPLRRCAAEGDPRLYAGGVGYSRQVRRVRGRYQVPRRGFHLRGRHDSYSLARHSDRVRSGGPD